MTLPKGQPGKRGDLDERVTGHSPEEDLDGVNPFSEQSQRGVVDVGALMRNCRLFKES